MFPINNLEKLLSFFRMSPELPYFLISTTMLASRLFLSFKYFSDFHYFILLFLFGQIILMIFIEKIKTILTKRFLCLNILSLSVHFLSIYLVPQQNFEFFLGIEISLIVNLNFKIIESKIMRYTILSFLMCLFMKKKSFDQGDFYNIIYFIYVLLVFQYIAKSEPLQENNRKKSEISEVKRISTTLTKKLTRMYSIKKTNKLYVQSNSIPNPFLNKEVIAKNILNIINVGILVINQDFEIIYANNCLFEFFPSKKLEEVKQILFKIEESQDIKKSNFEKIPDIFSFEKKIQKAKSFDTIQTKTEEFSKNLSNKSKKKRNSNLLIEECDNEFKKWKKQKLSDNLSETLLDISTKIPKPTTFLNYISQLLNYCKSNDEILTNDDQNNFDPQKNIEKYSMYANLPVPDNKEIPVLIKFILLKKEMQTSNRISSNHEIIITIRNLSEIEMKHKNDNRSKNKILGSFCHELRTPINGLINMLDLMHSYLDNNKKKIIEIPDKEFDQLLASASISSCLLLNQIDDFIDYFAYSNEMLELNVGAFDIHAFFNEISKIFSYVAIHKNLSLIIEIEDKIPNIVFNDHRKLRQILYNLLNNSIRYTESGFIKISAKLKKINYIEITVLDTGVGIKTLDLGFLGRLNKEKDLSRTTCGFGLFVSNILCHLIENVPSDKNKKGLVVYSKYGKGTCFCFSFKLDMRQEKDTLGKQRSSSSSIRSDKKEHILVSISSSIENLDKKPIFLDNLKPFVSNFSNEEIFSTLSINTTAKNLAIHGNGGDKIKNNFNSVSISEFASCKFEFSCECPKVLIVDDVPFNVEVCRRLLWNNKVASEYAYNGLEAIKIVENYLGNLNEHKFCDECKFYKLILMDVDMPIKNGIEATREILNLIKKTKFTVAIVGLSAFHQEEVKKRGREAGMREYILKPIDSNKMKDLIVKYILR